MCKCKAFWDVCSADLKTVKHYLSHKSYNVVYYRKLNKDTSYKTFIFIIVKLCQKSDKSNNVVVSCINLSARNPYACRFVLFKKWAISYYPCAL